MGSSTSIASAEDLGHTTSKSIDKQLFAERSEICNTVKLLLLGPGESGKSTIMKQLKILHNQKLNDTERRCFKHVVRSNLLECGQALVQAMDQLKIVYGSKEAQEAALYLAAAMSHGHYEDEWWTQNVCLMINRLWTDSGVQSCFLRASEYQLLDSAKYWFDNVDRIGLETYVPDDQDLLRLRVKTSGVVESNFIIQAKKFRVFDVGGQRSERRKWIHFFDDVDAIIFIIAISEYDQKMRENNHTNRLLDALELFDCTCTNRFLWKANIILFLNKTDLFELKINRVPITIAFPDYSGSAQLEDCREFIREKFREKVDVQRKTFYSHYTCATDTNQVSIVISDTIETVLKNLLSVAGL